MTQVFSTGSACYFKSTFGLPCPGCGMTRAYLSVFHGDLKAAMIWHPLWWIVLVYPMLHLGLNLIHKEKWTKGFLPLGTLSLLLIVYIWRMFNYFPNVAPMDYNHQSLLNQIVELIRNIK